MTDLEELDCTTTDSYKRNRLEPLRIRVEGIYYQVIWSKFQDLFEEDKLGLFTWEPIALMIDKDAKLIFIQAKQVSLVLKIKSGKIIGQTRKIRSNWICEDFKTCTPLVPIVKPDGNVWLCGYYHCTINSVSKSRYTSVIRFKLSFHRY